MILRWMFVVATLEQQQPVTLSLLIRIILLVLLFLPQFNVSKQTILPLPHVSLRLQLWCLKQLQILFGLMVNVIQLLLEQFQVRLVILLLVQLEFVWPILCLALQPHSMEI
jgi:hypothetical protein